MVFVAEITFVGNFFIGGKSAELHPFSTVSQVGDTSDWRIIALDFSHRSLKIYLKKDVKSPLSRRYGINRFMVIGRHDAMASYQDRKPNLRILCGSI